MLTNNKFPRQNSVRITGLPLQVLYPAHSNQFINCLTLWNTALLEKQSLSQLIYILFSSSKQIHSAYSHSHFFSIIFYTKHPSVTRCPK